MIEKKTILDRVEINREGHIQIRLAKQIIEDGVEIASQWHRTVVEPGGSVGLQMEAVNAHLHQMGLPPVDQSAIETLKEYSKIAFTPDKVAAHKLLNSRDLIVSNDTKEK